jgi:hypothetical protein
MDVQRLKSENTVRAVKFDETLSIGLYLYCSVSTKIHQNYLKFCMYVVEISRHFEIGESEMCTHTRRLDSIKLQILRIPK